MFATIFQLLFEGLQWDGSNECGIVLNSRFRAITFVCLALTVLETILFLLIVVKLKEKAKLKKADPIYDKINPNEYVVIGADGDINLSERNEDMKKSSYISMN